jgi:DNA-binding response OmpR family regulator
MAPSSSRQPPIRIDVAQRTAHVGDRQVKLTQTELRLLVCLFAEPGRTFSRQELMEAAIAGGAIVLPRTIDQHVAGLRRKIGPALIETVRGAGYQFRAPQGEGK